MIFFIKGTSRQRSGKGAIRKKFPLQKRGGKNQNCQLGTYIKNTYRKPSEQLLSNGRTLSYPILPKTMKTYMIFRQQKSTQKHKTNITIAEVSPWNDQ